MSETIAGQAPPVSAGPTSEKSRSLVTFLFNFKGRANRAEYWLTTLLGVAAASAIMLVAVLARDVVGGAAALTALILLPLLVVLVPVWAIAIRRLHDRGKSAHWLWLFLGLPALLDAANRAVGEDANPLSIFNLISLGLSLWFFVELGFLRGTAGPNRFGPDPLDAASAAAVAAGPAA